MGNNNLFNWFIFIVLSIIWGSSFVLMKESLISLSAYQVASIRIISAGLVLLPVAIKHIKSIAIKKLGIIFLSGILGSLIPAYLFCMAEEHIDSSLAGTLNALTPVFALIVGAIFFNRVTPKIKMIGIFISFAGSVLLFFAQPGFKENSNFIDVLFVLLATLCYGVNVNMVGRFLKDIPSLHIAAIALSLNAIPAIIILYATGYFTLNIIEAPILIATGYTFILGIFGTAIATILFYMLMKRAGIIFSSMVTYAIPIVAVGWGIVYGEKIGWKQIACLAVILAGVYITNKKEKQLN